MSRSDLPFPDDGMLVTQLVVAADAAETSRFYSEKLGGEIVFESPEAPTFVRVANTWVIVAEGGTGTPDQPDVVLAPPIDVDRFDAFMNIRVSDIEGVYRDWSARGVEFITPPRDNHGYEMRCYVRDPDGRIIEVGQHTGMLDIFDQVDTD